MRGFSELFRGNMHLEIATERSTNQQEHFVMVSTCCLCKKKVRGWSSVSEEVGGEGEAEFCSKSTEVYEICRLPTVFSDEESLCRDNKEEWNDEEYNSKYDSSTEIYPDNLTEGEIIALDKITTSYPMARECNR
ncbi:hypothetical protein TNCV_3287471 [Trichonephila clavipes]|nr:hypothetical protein TNCV_3287471 [Trichonephila clavipes]